MKRMGLLLMMAVFLFAGCSIGKVENIRVEDLDYTVVNEEDIPSELAALMEERKTEPFQLSYESDGYLYVARGYGAQSTGGYSISVSDMYLGEGAIYVQTDLSGPRTPADELPGTSYPYIVLKLEGRTEPVIFQ